MGSPLELNDMVDCLDDQFHKLKVIGERSYHLVVHNAFTIFVSILKMRMIYHLVPSTRKKKKEWK